MRRFLRNWWFIFAIIEILSCNGRNATRNTSEYLNLDKHDIERQKIDSKEWKCSKIQDEQVCVPKNWNQLNIKEALFYFDLGDSSAETYFAVNRYSKIGKAISAEEYLKEMYDVLLKDTVERLTEYKLTRLILTNQIAYFGEFYFTRRDLNFCFYMMTWESNNTMYDFGIKSKDSDKKKFYDVFQTILYNFESNGKTIFSPANKLEKIKVLKFDEL